MAHSIIVKSSAGTEKVRRQLRSQGHLVDTYSVRPVPVGYELSIPGVSMETLIKAAGDSGQRVLG